MLCNQVEALRGGKEGQIYLYSSPLDNSRGELEPRSVLDHHRSPSPPTSTSTLSSSLGGAPGAVAAVSDKWPLSDDWEPADLPPIPASLVSDAAVAGAGLDEWEAILADPPVSPAQDQTFLRWILGEGDDKNSIGFGDPCLSSVNLGLNQIGFSTDSSISLPLVTSFQDTNLGFQQNPSFLFPLPAFPAQQECQLPPPVGLIAPSSLKRQAVEPPGLEHYLRGIQPMGTPQLNSVPANYLSRRTRPRLDDSVGTGGDVFGQQQQTQALVDQLLKAAELVGSGNSVSARGILARLNHQLLSPVGKSVLRTAFYFKEALQLIANGSPLLFPSPSASATTPMDVVNKLRACKAFAEVSPVIQFTSFSCVQALLEEVGSAMCIHIIDFDLGIGGQWSALIQELAQQRSSAAAVSPMLKITAFVSPGCYHPLELHLTRENLCQFAANFNIRFELNVLSLEPFDPALLMSMRSGKDEVIAVNLPVGSAVYPNMPTLLRCIKQLSPKIVISVDHGCDHCDKPFANHFYLAFQSCNTLLDSLDAAGANQDVVGVIERFILQPRIENSVIGRHRSSEKTLSWRSLFASNGFVPVPFSNFTETQAECLLKRVQVRGFHFEKLQTSLSLCWRLRELVSISAWRC